MNKNILNYYLSTGLYTYNDPFREYFKELPDELETLCELICEQHVQRFILMGGNEYENKDMSYGDMNRYPWYRMRCEDDVLVTTAAMVAELFRLNDKGFFMGREVEERIIITCRNVTVLATSILRAKGIPCRCRAGFRDCEGKPTDHWLNQYWSEEQNRWVTFDPEGYLYLNAQGYTKYDIPYDEFDWVAKIWLDVRNGRINGDNYLLLDGTKSLKAIAKVLIYDFHALMNDEITYKFIPYFIDNDRESIKEPICRELDELAELMLEPDKNIEQITQIWETNRKFRILNSPLVRTMDNSKILFESES